MHMPLSSFFRPAQNAILGLCKVLAVLMYEA
jgi:hypothetical protein